MPFELYRIGERLRCRVPTVRCQARRAFRASRYWLDVPNNAKAEAEQLFGALGDGGQLQIPMTRTCPRFGMVADRSVSWMVYMTPGQYHHQAEAMIEGLRGRCRSGAGSRRPAAVLSRTCRPCGARSESGFVGATTSSARRRSRSTPTVEVQLTATPDAARHMVGLGTDDVDADWKRLKAAGVEFVESPTDYGRLRIATLRDPEGNDPAPTTHRGVR